MTTAYFGCRDLMVVDDSRNLQPSRTNSFIKINSLLYLLLQYIGSSNFVYLFALKDYKGKHKTNKVQ